RRGESDSNFRTHVNVMSLLEGRTSAASCSRLVIWSVLVGLIGRSDFVIWWTQSTCSPMSRKPDDRHHRRPAQELNSPARLLRHGPLGSFSVFVLEMEPMRIRHSELDRRL